MKKNVLTAVLIVAALGTAYYLLTRKKGDSGASKEEMDESTTASFASIDYNGSSAWGGGNRGRGIIVKPRSKSQTVYSRKHK